MPKGLSQLLSKINSVKTPGTIGLVTACLLVKAESQKICPVDTSNLIKGAYTDIIQESESKVAVEIGYQASYAPFVHEAPDKTNWQKPTAENKFLEKALLRNEKKILKLTGGSVAKVIR